MATPTFDVTGHPLLKDNPPVGDDLAIITLVAEYMLGVHDLALVGDDAEAMKGAVAMQVAFMLNGGLEPRKWAEQTDGQRKRIPTDAAKVGLDPAAKRLAESIAGGNLGQGYGTFDVVRHL